MASAAQVTANTANAKFSTGPKTDAGKDNAKRNAFKHGLTAATLVLSPEDMAIYETFSSGLLLEWKPVGPRESQLARILVDAHWRLNGIPAFERNIYALAQYEPAPEHLADIEDSPLRTALIETHALISHERHLRNLHLQEARLHRYIAATAKELNQLQAHRYKLLVEFHGPSQSEAPQSEPDPDPLDPIGFDFPTSTDDDDMLRESAFREIHNRHLRHIELRKSYAAGAATATASTPEDENLI